MLNHRKKPRIEKTPTHPRGKMTLTLFKELFLFEHGLIFEQQKHNSEQLERLVNYFEKRGHNCEELRKSFDLS